MTECDDHAYRADAATERSDARDAHAADAADVHRRRRVIVCVSPKAGSGQGRGLLPQLIQRLDQQGLEVLVSDDLAAVRAACQHDAPSGDGGAPLAVVPAGGDGTLALVADAVPASIPLVPYPLGTENLLARYYGFCTDPQRTAATVTGGRLHQIDAGRANGRLFLVMASCGFDAEVVRGMHLTRRGHIRRLSYAKPIFRAVRTYGYPPIQVRFAEGPGIAVAPVIGGTVGPGVAVDAAGPAEATSTAADRGGSWSPAVTCRWAMVFNLPSYGAGLRIEPDALDGDGLLDFFGLPLGSTWSTLRYVGGVITGQHRRWADTLRGRARRWHLSSEKRVPYQLDGDYVGRLPVEIEILPQRVTLRLPAGR